MASPLADDAPLRSYALPPSPCLSPTGSDGMSVWVEEVSDGEPRVRVALTDGIARLLSPSSVSRSASASPSSALDAPPGPQSPPTHAESISPPAPTADATQTVDFPLVLVGESRALIPHSATSMSAAIVPFQKLQMDTNLHQTTLPAHTNPRSSGSSSPSNSRVAFGNPFHSGDAMSQNFMEAMRLGDIVTRPQEPQLSVRLRGSRVELTSGSDDDAVDFLGPAENIKKLFKLPYSHGPVSLAVHRVGSTLVVDGGIDDVDLPPGFADDDDQHPQSANASAVHTQPKSIEHEKEREEEDTQKILYEKFIYQSTVAGRLLGGEEESGEASKDRHLPPSDIASKAKSHGRRGKANKHGRKATETVSSTAAPSSSPSPESFSFETDSTNRHAPSSTSASRSPSDRNPAFERVLKWKFNDLKMVLGSDVMLFSNPEHPAVSLRLHDMDKELSLATVLDYYLDNVIANIPELAICMHSKGVVRGYKLVETRQIPYMSGDAKRPLFDVQEVSLNAAMLLKFLKNNCTRPNGTYWLHRRQGENALRLYDVNVLSQGKQLKWKYMMAMLCYRFASRASRMMYSLTVDTPRIQKQLRLRQRDLLRTCVNLLKEIAAAGGAAHSSIRSSVAEQLADTYLREGDYEDEEYSTADGDRKSKTSAKADALIQANTYLRESIELFEECIQAESDSGALPTAEDDASVTREDAVGTPSGQAHDDKSEMDAFMKEELERLQMKCGSISLQLARIRIQESDWESFITHIREALQYVLRVTIPVCSMTLSCQTDNGTGEIDQLLRAIDFDGVRQKDDPLFGGVAQGPEARVCTTGSELRCFVLEVIGDAASKQPSETNVVSDLLDLYRRVSGDVSVAEGVDGSSHLLLLRQIAFLAYLRALFPAVDSELYFRLMKKLGNACNELGKYFLSTTLDHAAAFRWFERGCQVFSDIEDSVNVALLSANLAHLHKILAQKEACDFKQQQQHYEQAVHLCLDAASLLKHHKLDADAMLHRKVTGELALTYLVWGVALANTPDSQQESRDSDALKKFSKALALYTEIGDIKQSAATHYQIASFHARQISQEASNQMSAARDVSVPQKQSSSLKNRMEIARRHYEKALEYFGRMELGATFVLIHQELADLYALGGRVDDLDHALLVLLNTVHAFQTAGSQVQALARAIMTKIQSVIYQLVRLSATAAVTSSGAGKRATQANAKDDPKSLAMIDAYKRMYKEVLYFNAATTATAADSLTISPTLVTLQSIYDEVSSV